jgi:hypothetical protein
MSERPSHKRTFAIGTTLFLGSIVAAGCGTDQPWQTAGPSTTEQFSLKPQAIGPVVAEHQRNFVMTSERCGRLSEGAALIARTACFSLADKQVGLTDQITASGERYTSIKLDDANIMFAATCTTPNGVVGSAGSYLKVAKANALLESNVAGQTFRIPLPMGPPPDLMRPGMEPLFENLVRKDMPIDPCPTTGKVTPADVQYATY